jgi:drug/metabolite transporter (DMT)-like permease
VVYLKGILTQFPNRSSLARGLFCADLWLRNSSLITTGKITILAKRAAVGWTVDGNLSQITSKLLFGLAISITGMMLIVGIDALREFSINIGDLMAIAASIFYAAYLLITQRARNSVDTLTFNFIYMFAAVLILLPINLVGGYQILGFSERSWLALIDPGLVSNWAAGWQSITRDTQCACVSVSLLGQAVVTALLGISIL